MEKLSREYLDLGNVKIAYCEHGTGPVLILLHGNSESKAIFSQYQREHFKMFCTIALDSRGHGESISDDTQYSIRQYSEDVIRFCKAKGIDQASVIGYSDGGNIALFLAKDAPDIFKKVVAISPNYLVSGTTDGTLAFFKASVGILKFLGKLGLPTRKALMRFDLMLTDIGISTEELSRIQTNMLILYAEKDLIKEDHILEMGRLIPSAAVKKIARCNHLNIYTRQEAIEEIRNHLLG